MFELDQSQLNKRMKVLQIALFFESFLSNIIAALLDIDFESSNTLGNKSSALPLKTKVDLLMDMRSFKNEDKVKFQKFMEIRNQFMHNFHANSYENCIKNIKGSGEWLLKNYKQSYDLDLELKYEKSIECLMYDLISTTIELTKKVKEKYEKSAKSEVIEKFFEALKQNLEDVTQQFDEEIKEKIDKNDTNIQEFKGIAKAIKESVLQKTSETFKED